LMSDFIL